MSCCCIPLQFALILVLTFAPCAGGVFLPSTGANTPLAHVVVSTCCNLRCWCFSFQQLAQILHLHMWWSSAVATCAGGVFSSNHWRKYSTCTRATCTVWWYVYIYIRHGQFVTPRLRKSHAGASCIIRAGRLRNIHGRFAQHLRPVCALFVDKGQ